MPDASTRALTQPALSVLIPVGWEDYELLDSGNGTKLERFGPYRLIRPESAAIWQKSWPEKQWQAADGVYSPREAESGRWLFHRQTLPRWDMRYGELRFWAQPTPFRHLGVFPEQATQWEWVGRLIRQASRPVNVLSLFAYTGLATLAAAAAGASVTHVDASKTTIAWARENQSLCGLGERPVRWILDDALKFALREARRHARYDGFILDPPKFGRGPKGEIWKLEETLPALLLACKALMSEHPLFFVLTTYSAGMPALSVRYLLEEIVGERSGQFDAGELGIAEQSAGRIISTAAFARWSARQPAISEGRR